ncbi:MAG: hypothetical protein FJ217_04190 [Ignavibacteria bacterium]|nr:hypothetical protein [Ignavibacteria bacterium]
MKTSLLLRFLLWGMLIFAISVGLMSFRALRTLELKTVNIALSLRYGKSFGSAIPKRDVPVVPISLWGQISNDMYLRHALDIVKSLNKAGARVVVVPLPSDLIMVPRIVNLLDKISAEGISVFSATTTTISPSFPRSASFLDNRKNWWVRHPALQRVDMVWGISSIRSEPFGVLYRFVPNEYRDFDSGALVPDVSLQALKRYLGLGDSFEIHHTPFYEFFDTYRIPLESDGFAYVKYSFNPSDDGSIYAFVQPETDSLAFFPIRRSGAGVRINLDSAWAFYRDKIVILDWGALSQYQSPSLGWGYVQIIGAILTRSFVDRYNEYDLFFIMLAVVFLSVISFNYRGMVTLLLSLVLSLGIIALSLWLFDHHSILFDPVYILVPILLCAIVLPIVKLAEEKRMLLEQIRSLEEEKRRLEELRNSGL